MWALIRNTSIIKTLRFNFKYLKFRDAIKCPFILSRQVRLRSLGGSVVLLGAIRGGMVQMGYDKVAVFDNKRSRSIWEVNGKVVFKGKSIIGHGSKISVLNGGCLTIGVNFVMTAESTIICASQVAFGDNCLLSWDILVQDTDFYKILNSDNQVTNTNAPIEVADNVWIGCRSTILKGVSIAAGSVVGAGSVVVRSVSEPNSISGGGGQAKLLDRISNGKGRLI